LEAVDAELDRLISRRASADLAEDPDTKEERWKASVRAYNARHRATLEALIAHHTIQAEKLLKGEA
jgi:hypothetical protein